MKETWETVDRLYRKAMFHGCYALSLFLVHLLSQVMMHYSKEDILLRFGLSWVFSCLIVYFAVSSITTRKQWRRAKLHLNIENIKNKLHIVKG